MFQVQSSPETLLALIQRNMMFQHQVSQNNQIQLPVTTNPFFGNSRPPQIMPDSNLKNQTPIVNSFHNSVHISHQQAPKEIVYSTTQKDVVKPRGIDAANKKTIWKGDFVTRNFNTNFSFSNKLFIGGIPPHMAEDDIVNMFGKFDKNLVVEWPDAHVRPSVKPTSSPYLRIILSSSELITNLLNCCELVIEGGCETFNFGINYKNRRKQLQVVPWLSIDSHYRRSLIIMPSEKRYTVFVGALHGRMHAKALAHIFDEIFGDVTSVVIDTDEHNYPTGSGRVTFGNVHSFRSAIMKNYIQIESKKVSKRVQIEPCIDGQSCCSCPEENVPNFCKEIECFDYYCNPCWLNRHKPDNGHHLVHTPIRRKSKNL